MPTMKRCRNCYHAPDAKYNDGSWTISCCDIIAFSLGDAEAVDHADDFLSNYHRAVSRWNERIEKELIARVA